MTDSSHLPPSHPPDSSDSVADLSDSSFVSWSKTVYFLSVTLEMDREFQSIEYAASGMFDLCHTETLKQLELRRSVQTVNFKVQIARSMLKWLAANREERSEE